MHASLSCARPNDGMLALARGLGCDVEHVPGGTTVVVSLELATATIAVPPKFFFSPPHADAVRCRERGVATTRHSIPSQRQRIEATYANHADRTTGFGVRFASSSLVAAPE